jgi:hypothetical protein
MFLRELFEGENRKAIGEENFLRVTLIMRMITRAKSRTFMNMQQESDSVPYRRGNDAIYLSPVP